MDEDEFEEERAELENERDEWKEKFPALKEAQSYALRCIGDRREILALERDISETIMLKRQHAYDPDWAADRKQDRQEQKEDKIQIGIEVAKATAAAKVQADNDNRPGAIPLGPVNSKEYQEYVKQIEAMQVDKDPVE